MPPDPNTGIVPNPKTMICITVIQFVGSHRLGVLGPQRALDYVSRLPTCFRLVRTAWFRLSRTSKLSACVRNLSPAFSRRLRSSLAASASGSSIAASLAPSGSGSLSRLRSACFFPLPGFPLSLARAAEAASASCDRRSSSFALFCAS